MDCFHDIEKYLSENVFNLVSPALKGTKPQFTTETANMLRKVTNIRWVLKIVHSASAPKHRLLHRCVDHKMLRKIKSLCTLVGSVMHLGHMAEFSEYIESRSFRTEVQPTKIYTSTTESKWGSLFSWINLKVT